MNYINFTDAVTTRLAELISNEGNPNLKLRVSVQGGGCSGFSYGFSFDEVINDDDFTFVRNNVTIIIDSISMQYLNNATIDYIENLQGSSFTIDNPHAESTCGCGSSFSMSEDNGSDFDDFGHGY